MLGLVCAGLFGCAPPERFFTITVANPCSYPVEVWVWSAPEGREPQDRGLPNDGIFSVGAHASQGFTGLPWRPTIVRIDQLGFRQELIPPPGGVLADTVLTPDAASCGS